jgi:hypothetical protein
LVDSVCWGPAAGADVLATVPPLVGLEGSTVAGPVVVPPDGVLEAEAGVASDGAVGVPVVPVVALSALLGEASAGEPVVVWLTFVSAAVPDVPVLGDVFWTTVFPLGAEATVVGVEDGAGATVVVGVGWAAGAGLDTGRDSAGAAVVGGVVATVVVLDAGALAVCAPAGRAESSRTRLRPRNASAPMPAARLPPALWPCTMVSTSVPAFSFKPFTGARPRVAPSEADVV